MDKIKALKQLVGEDVAEEILSTSKSLTTRAKRLGLRYKEAHMPTKEFDKLFAAYKAIKALEEFSAEGDGEAADFDDEVLFEDDTLIEVEVETEKAQTAKMDTRMIEDAVMKAVKAAFAEMRADDDMEEDGMKAKEIDTLKEANAALLKTVKELSDRVTALEQPIASGSGYRLTDVNPQTTAKELQGAAVNGTIGLLDSLGGIQ